jgi:hypothetical protein
LTFGVKDVDYTYDANGNPVLTKEGNADANYVPWKYTIQHPFVFFTSDIPKLRQDDVRRGAKEYAESIAASA